MTSPAIQQWLDQLRVIDIHQIAAKIGLKRNGSNGNYSAPNRDDKQPSLSLHNKNKYGQGWKDHTTGDAGGTIDLLIYAGIASDFMSAATTLGNWFGLPKPATNINLPRKPSKIDFIAGKCKADPYPASEYLLKRGIHPEVINLAIQRRTLGWNNYVNPTVPEGQPGHGGPAVAFMIYNAVNSCIAVDMRYVDAELNGGVKTQCQGEKNGYFWTSDLKKLASAHTIYVVESPINALSVETAFWGQNGIASLAIRGVANVAKIDWAFLRGKKVLIALDQADKLNPHTQKRPGLAAAWDLYDRLTATDVAARLVDMLDWDEGQDINDVLQETDSTNLKILLKKTDPWLISGMPSVNGEELEKSKGRRRVFLPNQDWNVYWRYRLMDDFTQYVQEFKEDIDEDGNRERISESLKDLCGFRLAAISRLSIQGHLATINGSLDAQPETVFGISVQLPRSGSKLHREVIQGEKIYNLDWWKRLGPIWLPAQFSRMLTIMERSAHLAARDVVNFVGLAWRDGRLAALEGNDCFFTEPAKQCLYHNMTFPRGDILNARRVISAYQETFKQNAAAIPLVWALGAHLKCVLGYWPHFQMDAEKGSGKSKLLESLQSTLAFQVLSGQMLKTDHRRRASVSYTSHPVGWDEYSKLPKAALNDVDGVLQSTYRFEFTRVGSALTPYLMCAPVLLAGEEVDVESLQSKICRSSLSVKKQGPMIEHDLPQFPVYNWLQYLASLDPEQIRTTHKDYLAYCSNRASSDNTDATARRMMENYAAIFTAWAYLCDFAGIAIEQGNFLEDGIAEMNSHLMDTDGTRLPWVWIMEILLSELEAKHYEHPFLWERVEGEWVLMLRANHVMDHISTANHLRDKYNHLPIKTGRVFKRQLMASGVVVKGMEDVERTISGRRTAHLTAISLKQLEKLGLYATPWEPKEIK